MDPRTLIDSAVVEVLPFVNNVGGENTVLVANIKDAHYTLSPGKVELLAWVVDMPAATPKDIICDPARGTADFLVATAKYLADHLPAMRSEAATRERFAGNFKAAFPCKTYLKSGATDP